MPAMNTITPVDQLGCALNRTMAHLQQPAGGMAANEFCFQLTLVRQ